MKLKKGITWLQRDFEEDLKERLSDNLVVDLGKMADFPGRGKLIENMISREELEEAKYVDIQAQKQVDALRKKQGMAEKTRQEKLEEEEAALRKAMNL